MCRETISHEIRPTEGVCQVNDIWPSVRCGMPAHDEYGGFLLCHHHFMDVTEGQVDEWTADPDDCPDVALELQLQAEAER